LLRLIYIYLFNTYKLRCGYTKKGLSETNIGKLHLRRIIIQKQTALPRREDSLYS